MLTNEQLMPFIRYALIMLGAAAASFGVFGTSEAIFPFDILPVWIWAGI